MRRLLEYLAAAGLLTAVFATGGRIVEIWVEGDDDRVCESAHNAMLDDGLNGELTVQQRTAYLKRQYEIAMSCSRSEPN